MALIAVKNICKIFPDSCADSNGASIDSVALYDVSFELEKGDFMVITGSNGSGKSVLMSIIAELDVPTSGCVTNKENKYIGLVFQDADAQILGETPEEDIAFGPSNMRLSKSEIESRVTASLKAVGLLHKRYAPSRLLSGGEKRRLAVAGILAMDGEIFIFDEPFANLDWPGIKQVYAILEKLKADGKTVIVLTHELEKVIALAQRFVVLDKGKIQFDGAATDGLKLDLEQWGIRHPLNWIVNSN